MAFSVSYLYELHDRYTKIADKISRSSKRMKKQFEKTAASSKKLAKQLNKQSAELTNLGGVVSAVAGAAALGKLIAMSSSLEDSMGDVRRVINFASKKEFSEFKEKIIGLTGPLVDTAENLSEIVYQGSKFSIPKDQIVAFTKVTRKMGIAFDISAGEAGRSIGSIKAKLDLSMPSVIRLADSVNYLADNFAADGTRMINIIERTSGQMKLLKMPPEVIAGFAAFADQVEVSPELAASGINQMIAKMLQMKNIAPQLMKAPTETIRKVMKEFAEMPEAQRAQQIYKRFGLEAGKFMLKAVGSIKLFDKTLAAAAGGKSIGSIDREFKNFANRFSTQAKQMRLSFTEMFRSIGDVLKKMIAPYVPMLNRFAKGLRRFVLAHPGLVKIGLALFTLVIALSALALAAGLAMGAFAALLPLWGALAAAVAALTWPIAAAIAGVVAVSALFVSWYNSGHPLISVLMQIAGTVWEVIKSIAAIGMNLLSMLGIVQGGQSALSGLGTVIDFIGIMFAVALKPLQIFLATVQTLFSVLERATAGDFMGAWENLKGGGKAIFEAATDFGFGKEAAQNKVKNETNNTELTGEINVRAEKGSEVINAGFRDNTGSNLTAAF